MTILCVAWMGEFALSCTFVLLEHCRMVAFDVSSLFQSHHVR